VTFWIGTVVQSGLLFPEHPAMASVDTATANVRKERIGISKRTGRSRARQGRDGALTPDASAPDSRL
jgi:hypothetical protein